MASPFPGMDPYLEGELWQEFHQTFAGEIRRQINPKLRPKYVALLEKYYVMRYSGVELLDMPPLPHGGARTLYPDVGVVTSGISRAAATKAIAEMGATPASAIVQSPDNAIPQMRVIIRDVAQRRLVTVIEILSTINKVGEGARTYHTKRNDIFESTAHLIEIDFLRAGMRPPTGEPLPPADYYVLLNRATARQHIAVWAMHLTEQLPVVPVPLLEPDPDILLDLQAALTDSFDVVGYDLLIDYTTQPPAPELSPEETAWINALLKAKGLRT